MTKHNAKGRSKYMRYVRLEHWLLNSPAWRALKPGERAVYIELCKLYNGANNGAIALSNRDAAERCNISKNTAGKHLNSLCEIGFIKVRTPSTFARKNRLASEYELTEYSYFDRQPTKDFMGWTPKVKKNNSTKIRTPRTNRSTPKDNIPKIRLVGGTGLIP